MENDLISLAFVNTCGCDHEQHMKENLNLFLWETLQALPYHPMRALPSPQSILLLFWICFNVDLWPWILFFFPSFSFYYWLHPFSSLVSGLCSLQGAVFFSSLLWFYYFRLYARLSCFPLPALDPRTAARTNRYFFSY